jgi:predicted amidophosphoribosyltransferase
MTSALTIIGNSSGHVMPQCPSCAFAMPEGSHYCASCGSPLESRSSADTVTSGPPSISATSSDDGRFAAGTVVAGRYRIIGLAHTVRRQA